MSETTNLEVVAQHGGRVQGTQDALPEPALRAAPGGADDVLGQGRVFCQRKHRAVTSKPHCLQPHFVHFPDERGAQRVLGLSRWRWRFAGKARPASPGRDDSGFRLRCPSPAAPSGPASCSPSGGSPCPVHPGRPGSHPPSRVRVSTALHSRTCWLGSGELTRTPIWAPGPHPSEAASCLLLTRLSGTCSVPAAPSSSARHPRVSQGFRPASHRSPPWPTARLPLRPGLSLRDTATFHLLPHVPSTQRHVHPHLAAAPPPSLPVRTRTRASCAPNAGPGPPAPRCAVHGGSPHVQGLCPLPVPCPGHREGAGENGRGRPGRRKPGKEAVSHSKEARRRPTRGPAAGP